MTALLIAYALNIIDYILTAYWVNLYGTEGEVNPFMRWCFEHDIAWAVKIFAIGGVFCVLGYLVKRYPYTAWSGYVLAVVYAIVVVYHIVLAAILFL